MPQRAGIQSVEVGLAHRHLLRTVLLVLALHLLALWGWPQLPTTTATPAQAAAVEAGIKYGWSDRRANPALYDADGAFCG